MTNFKANQKKIAKAKKELSRLMDMQTQEQLIAQQTIQVLHLLVELYFGKGLPKDLLDLVDGELRMLVAEAQKNEAQLTFADVRKTLETLIADFKAAESAPAAESVE